eukprot:Lithocolla_globosa_v1_NODE_94_length_6505_cov_642.519311.p7 type:complete len:122 gc:universal NODE_94_length_6505_cov_642.519311:904-539(-)
MTTVETNGNPWLEHLKQFQKENPDKTYKECMSLASATYKKKPKTVKGGFALLPKDPLTAGLELGTAVVTSGTNLTGQVLASDPRLNRVNLRQYKRYKKQMEKGKVPQMSDEEIWEWATRVR